MPSTAALRLAIFGQALGRTSLDAKYCTSPTALYRKRNDLVFDLVAEGGHGVDATGDLKIEVFVEKGTVRSSSFGWWVDGYVDVWFGWKLRCLLGTCLGCFDSIA